MNKTMQQPNGPGPSMAEQAAFVNGKGVRLIGAPDSPHDKYTVNHAEYRRDIQKIVHWKVERNSAFRLGKVIGTASRH